MVIVGGREKQILVCLFLLFVSSFFFFVFFLIFFLSSKDFLFLAQSFRTKKQIHPIQSNPTREQHDATLVHTDLPAMPLATPRHNSKMGNF
jgi:hypothetical protein